jgi:putative lipoic acid-binding regulatory protein
MLALLESQHSFPGSYTFRVVVRPAHRTEVVTALAAVEATAVESVDEQPSRKGTYLSVRVTARVDSAEAVLEVYDVLQRLDSVLAVM